MHFKPQPKDGFTGSTTQKQSIFLIMLIIARVLFLPKTCRDIEQPWRNIFSLNIIFNILQTVYSDYTKKALEARLWSSNVSSGELSTPGQFVINQKRDIRMTT